MQSQVNRLAQDVERLEDALVILAERMNRVYPYELKQWTREYPPNAHRIRPLRTVWNRAMKRRGKA